MCRVDKIGVRRVSLAQAIPEVAQSQSVQITGVGPKRSERVFGCASHTLVIFNSIFMKAQSLIELLH